MENMKQSTSVIIIDKEGKVLVLKRNPADKTYPGVFDLPGGRVEGKETLVEAAKREALEESGLEVDPEENYVFTNTYEDGEINYVFKVRSFKGDVALSKEHMGFAWVSKNNWEKLEYTPEVKTAIKNIFKN